MSDKNLSRLKKDQLISLSQGLKDINNLLIETLAITFGLDKATILKELRKKPKDGFDLFDRMDRLSPENFKDFSENLDDVSINVDEVDDYYETIKESTKSKPTKNDSDKQIFDFELKCLIDDIESGEQPY